MVAFYEYIIMQNIIAEARHVCGTANTKMNKKKKRGKNTHTRFSHLVHASDPATDW